MMPSIKRGRAGLWMINFMRKLHNSDPDILPPPKGVAPGGLAAGAFCHRSCHDGYRDLALTRAVVEITNDDLLPGA
jgi:hypothetical protein